LIRFLDIRRPTGETPDPRTDPDARRHLYLSVFVPAVLVALLWAVHGLAWAAGWDLSHWGVYPRHAGALSGILTAPLVHADWGHLTANSVPLLVLGFLLYNAYRKVALRTLAIVWLLSGAGIWLLGREAWHIGASGVVFGVNFFLFFSGVFRMDLRSLALALLVAFAYGGMVWGIFPLEPGVSFEAHAAGAAAGLLCAWMFRHVDRPPATVWDDEEEDDDVPPGPGLPGPRVIRLRYTVRGDAPREALPPSAEGPAPDNAPDHGPARLRP
jgi:membrane associated rhomboid family serine protease